MNCYCFPSPTELTVILPYLGTHKRFHTDQDGLILKLDNQWSLNPAVLFQTVLIDLYLTKLGGHDIVAN